MSASINTSKGSLGAEFFKKTAGYISGGVGEYFKDAMPIAAPAVSDAVSTVKSMKSAFTNTAQDVLPKIRQMKVQVNMKSMLNWFLDKEDQFSFDSGGSNELSSWDDGTTSDGDTIGAQISEAKENANQISGAIVESIHKSVESQISMVANISSTIEKQTAFIATKIDTTNEILNKLLEITTKNTATLIETTAALNRSDDSDTSGRTGKFKLSDYIKGIQSNIKKSEFGAPAMMAMSMLPMLKDPNQIKQMFLNPETIFKSIIPWAMNKAAPNAKKNLQALDNTINDILMSSLIRLGESNNYGNKGTLSRIFGIDSSRKDVNTNRSSLNIKSVPFDTITKEAITSAIPGYLRKILVAVGGEDLVYDYKSRRFRTQKSIRNDFRRESTYDVYGALRQTSDRLGNKIDPTDYNSMLYSLMMLDLGSKSGRGGKARDTVSKFKNSAETEKYVMSLLGSNATKSDKKGAKEFAKALATLTTDDYEEIIIQAAKNNLNRQAEMKEYVEMMDQYGVDLSFIKDSVKGDRKHILKQYGRKDLESSSEIKEVNVSSGASLRGVDYTNAALYEIYRRLNEGINVFQVGSKKVRNTPFTKFDDSYLPKPSGHKPKSINSPKVVNGAVYEESDMSGHQYDGNPLVNGVDEEGAPETLSKGERFKRWGKKRGGQFKDAMFNGSPEDMRKVVVDSFRDISGMASEGVKSGIATINDKFGNISGYLSHKIFGGEYSYNEVDPQSGKIIQKTVGKNEKGGLFGFVSDKVKGLFDAGMNKTSKWFNDVAGYFDYGDSGGKKDTSIEAKRKKILKISVGAFAGAGILGGPIGLLVGGLAGNALSSLDIGNKLKEKLFGKDDEGKPTGIISKAADKIITPIQYQFQKTAHHLGNTLKKNILGPLSDIGWAVKERITDSAHSAFSKAFGFIGDKIKNGLGHLGNAAGKLFEWGTGAAGMYTRGKMSAKSAIPGAAMTGIAYAIAPGWHNKELSERRRQRNQAIKDDEFEFSNYKSFRDNKYKRNKDKDTAAELSDYTKETVTSTKEIESSNSDIASNTSKTVEVLEDIRDNIRGTSGGKSHKASSTSEEVATVSSGNNNDFANSGLVAAITSSMSGDDVSNDEFNEDTRIIDEASNDNPNKRSISTRLKSLLRMQKGNKDDSSEEKESIWSKIASGIGSVIEHLPAIALGVAALLAFLKNPDGFISRIASAVSGIFNFLSGNSDTDATTTGMNAVTEAVLDSKVDNAYDWATPGKSIKHAQTDAAGNDIINSAMTEAKEETLWKSTARSQLLGIATPGTAIANMKSNIKLGQASLTNKALNFANDHLGGFGSKVLSKKLDNQLNQAADYDTLARSPQNTTVAGSVGRAVGRVGTLSLLSKGAGLAVEGIAGNFVSDEAAATIGDVGEMATSGFLTANMIKSAATGKQSIVDKVLDGIIKAFEWIAKKLGAEKVVEKVGSSKIVESFNKVATKIVDSIKSKFDDLIVKKIQALFAKWGVEVSASTVTAGLAIAGGAIAGMASGYCGTEHLFGVLPGEADDGMKATSTILGGILGGLEWSPLGWIVVIFDVLDALLISIPHIELTTPLFTVSIGGVGIKQMLARLIYSVLGGEANLEEKQEAFQKEREYYNTTYDTNLDTATFSDMVNSTGFFDKIWNGSNSVDEETGHLTYDEAGKSMTSGGMKSWFVGKENTYVKDSDGNVVRDPSGKAVVQVDENGRAVLNDKKWGNYVGDFFNNVGRFFGGGDVYKTDENGNAIYNTETGEYEVDHHTGNIFERMGINISNEDISNGIKTAGNITTAISDTISGAGMFKGFFKAAFGKEDGEEEAKNEVLSTIGEAVQTITNPFYSLGKSIKAFNNLDVETDENGDPILDDEGKPIKKEGLGAFIKGALGNATKAALNPFSGVTDAISEISKLDQVVDENGDPILDDEGKPIKKTGILDWVKKASGKINSFMLNPVRTVVDSIEEAVSDSDESEESDTTDILSLVNKISKVLLLGPAGVGVGGPVSTEDISGDTTTDTANESANESVDPGGNPLNKPFRITSGFGATSGRPHSGAHKGIDIIPADGSKDADVGARFSGTITNVTNGIPDTMHAEKQNGQWTFPYDKKYQTGNMVEITTDDGLVIKNMHLKAGSIPSNIKAGTRVNIGDKIGTMGSTGWSTGAHLHYEFDQNGSPVDPTKSASSGSTMSQFNTTGSSTTASSDSESAETTATKGQAAVSTMNTVATTTTSTEESTSGQGALASLISALKTAGSQFLSKITGGLLGSSDSSSTTTTATYSTSSGTTVDSEGITGNCNNKWITVVRDIKKLVAEQKPNYDQTKYINIGYNGKTYRTRTDCTGIICTMLKAYGVMGDSENLNSTGMLNKGAIRQGFDLVDWPGWDRLVEGDILVVSGHAEIFCKNDGSKHYVYNGGSTPALCNPGATCSSRTAYSKIWRCKEEVAQISNKSYGDPSKIVGSNSDSVYEKLKELGYSDAAASGIMGVWQAESHNDSKTVEGNYLKQYPGYDTVMASNESMNDYTKNVLFPAYSNKSINKTAYLGDDGNYYPGIGLAQWTGPRHYKLKQYADKKGADWRSLDTQIEYMDQEKASRGIGDDFKEYDDPSAAAEFFARKFEGTTKESMLAPRRSNAETFFSQYQGKYDSEENNSTLSTNTMTATDGNVGGPVDDVSSLASANYSRSVATAKLPNTGTKNSTLTWKQPSVAPISDGSSTNNAEMVQLLREVLTELKAINGNTGTSNSLLTSINQSGFVDQGLRSSLSSLKGTNNKNTARHLSTSSSSNNRMVSSLVRPK